MTPVKGSLLPAEPTEIRSGARAPVAFLGLPMAITVRDVLRTSVFSRLVEGGVEVHLFTPRAHDESFRREFAAPGVHFHALAGPPAGWFTWVDAQLMRVQALVLSLRCETAAIMTARSLQRNPFGRGARWVLGRSRRLQDGLLGAIRWTYLRFGPELYEDEFRRHDPDLVIGTRPLTMTDPRSASAPRYLDRHLMLSAARRGVPTMVLVSSWDNLTTSGFFPCVPDRITVWNEPMKEQAIGVHGLRADSIEITGAPQHDVYAQGAFRSRGAFLDGLGLDPGRPVLVYATGTEGTIPDEPALVESIAQRIARDLPGAQLLVRLHQLDRRDRYDRVAAHPHVTLDQAGRPQADGYADRDFERGELEKLADTLRHADVVLTFASSIGIDATAVGTPVVMVDFDARPGLTHHASGRRFYGFTHMLSLLECGGVARVEGLDELIVAIRSYLADRGRDEAGRTRLVQRQCHRLDGGSGQRVAEAVLAQLARARTVR